MGYVHDRWVRVEVYASDVGCYVLREIAYFQVERCEFVVKRPIEANNER